MVDQAYFGEEKSLSSIFPPQTIVIWLSTRQANSSRKSKNKISLKNIGLIHHFFQKSTYIE